MVVVVVWVMEVGGGLPPNSLRFTICCISAKVPPESTCTMTHMVSEMRYGTLQKISENKTLLRSSESVKNKQNSFVMIALT